MTVTNSTTNRLPTAARTPRTEAPHHTRHHATHTRGHSTRDTFTPAAANSITGARTSTVAPTSLDGVNQNDPTLQTLATGRLHTGAGHTCVKTTRANLTRLGVAHPNDTDGDRENNPRGAMVQMMNNNGWRSVSTPGSSTQTISSPYGTVQAAVIPADEYRRLADAGQIPSGALVFQTNHDSWNDNSRGSRGFDMGIARNGGAQTFNYGATRTPLVYRGGTQSVVVLVPPTALPADPPAPAPAA